MDPQQVVRDADGVRRCRECGFRYGLAPREVSAEAGRGLEAVRDALDTVPEASRQQRPSPEVWSVNAYMHHLADAAEVITGRVRVISEEERPLLPNHDQERAVEEGRGDEQPASASLRRLAATVEEFQRLVPALPPGAWERVGRHSTVGAVRLQDVAHDMPHELLHHAGDIRRVGGRAGQGTAGGSLS